MYKTYSYEQAKEVIEKTGCKLISKEYINSKTKMEILCSCGKNTFWASLNNVTSGKVLCTDCIGKKIGRIYWDYSKVKKYLIDNGCELISKEYKTCKDKLKIRCRECKEEYITDLSTILKWNKFTCNKCSNKRTIESIKYTYEEVKEMIESLSDCKLLSKEYIDNKQDLELLCGCKKHTFKTSLNTFLRKNKKQCGYCSGKITWSFTKVKRWIEDNSDCELLETEYINIKTKMFFRCKCGNAFHTSFDEFKTSNKRQCNECGQKNGNDTKFNKYEDVYEEILKTGCKLLSTEYVGVSEQLSIKCAICGESFDCSLDVFRNKAIKACPTCNKKVSAGERAFKKLLKQNKINFKHQHSYKDCVYKKRLQFDFLIKDLGILVEIDGDAHRRAIDYWGGEERLKEQQIKDKIKDDYCKTNNILLIRIPYYDQDEKIELFIERCKPIIEDLKNKLKIN